MSEQPFLAAGFIFVVVMTLALIRLGRNAGGWHWAAAWTSLWAAGSAAFLRESAPALAALLPAFGTAVAALLLAGTLRFLDRPTPRGYWLATAGVAALRVALLPWTSWAAVQVTGAVLISAAAVLSSALLLRQHRADGARGGRLLAIAFPTAAIGSSVYAWGTATGAPPWVGLFVWLMAGILLSGTQVLSLIRRIADRAESERAVLASLIEAVPVGLALFDPQGALRAANLAFQKIVGLSPGEAAQGEAGLLEALAERVEPEHAAALQRASESHLELDGELHFKSGLRIVAAVHVVTGPRGERIGRLWLMRDVTEERRLRDGLEQARRLETLGGFAGGVAHDFNNQLTSVLGNAVLARESLSPDHPAREILADLEASAEYCARLTQDVLDFARRGPGQRIDIELDRLLPELLAHRDSDRAALSIAADVPPVSADPVQIERVVRNLVENARYAAGGAGRVELLARRAEQPGRVVIEVRDDGPGIDESLRNRIFDPFFTTKPVGEGSGLGLAIVYGIVTGQGGDVRVECPAGAGTRVVTTWPMAASS